MAITYRTRRRWRNLGVFLLVLIVLAAVAWLCWALWLGRYITYSRDGARLDFSFSSSELGGQQVQRPTPQETVGILYNDGNELISTDVEMKQMVGYYLTMKDLQGDMTALKNTLSSLEKGSAVMLDLKSGRGGYFYSSSLTGIMYSDSVSRTAVDDLISFLVRSDLYAIARIPAFQDWNYALRNHEARNYVSLALESGALWMDDESCYWLDPEKNTVSAYLINIAKELEGLGFNEVVFSKFIYPTADEIVYRSGLDKKAALEKLAADLVESCATDRFAVSFQTDDTGFILPEGRSRLYITGVPADQVASVAASVHVSDTAIGLVFMAETNDTRYDAYGTLRPIDNLG